MRVKTGDIHYMKRLIILTLILGFYPKSAHAILGEKVQVRTLKVVNNKYSISSKVDEHHIHTSEFFDHSGNVFGVCWKSSSQRADTKSLLGEKYSSLYSEKIKTAVHRKGQRIVAIKDKDMLINEGHIGRGYFGCVADPKLIPEGVSTHEIH